MARRLLAGAVLVALHVIAARAATNDIWGGFHDHTVTHAGPFLRVRSVKAWGESRPALLTAVPHTVDVPVTIPPRGRLQVGMAMLDRYFTEDMIPLASPTRFVVSLVRASGEEELLVDRTLDIHDRPQDRRWIAMSADLGRFAGETATLRFHVELAGDPEKNGRTFALWGRSAVIDPAADKPNLLFVTIDALRADHLGCYGYGRPTSPALDRLAREGVRFAHAYTNAPMTSPSLPQIFTSSYFPSVTSPTLLSSLFADGVPRTKAIIHNPFLDYFLRLGARDTFDSISHRNWRADRIAGKAGRWIEAQGTARWALYLHFLDTHTPYRVPFPEAARFRDPQYDGPVKIDFGDVQGAQHGTYDATDQREVIALYDAALRYVDDHLGRLLESLRSRGLLDHTLVVVSADHGEELWDHGSFFHGVSLYDEQLHVPLIVRLPGGAHAGTTVDADVRSIDIVPTIAEVLGAPVFPEFQGTSLLPLVRDPAQATSREDFARASNPAYPFRFALRTPTHKLVETLDPAGEALFDLRADPHERTNLATAPDARAVLDDLRGRLATYRKPLWESAFQVRAVGRADAPPTDLEITIAANDEQALSTFDRLGPPGTAFTVGADSRSIAWRGAVGATPIGFRFERPIQLAEDGGLTVRVRANGTDLPPSAILVGDGGHPAASPFVYKEVQPRGQPRYEEPALLVATSPAAATPTDQPVVVQLWRLAGEAAAAGSGADPETRRKLHQLGYTE
jgi:arylsulfatase A-like enzyme